MAERKGFHSTTEWILYLADQSRQRGRFQIMWDGRRVGGAPVMAFIDFGRWCAQCECGQVNYADPDEPVMFCARCGNGNTGMARQVIFSAEEVRSEIGRLLMERPVVDHPLAKDRIEAARLAKPVYSYLPRNWYPSQSIEDLIAMNSTMPGGR
jgi:hypothetical protein